MTQVTSVWETHLFHNRLTHTLKVAQIAQRLAQSLRADPDNAEHLADGGGPHVDCTEAAALAHDLGHPPFGHIAEKELDDKCVKAGLDGFEGNAQSFRIVTRLSYRASDLPGLSLTPRTLNAIIKYPWLREGDHAGDKKWNAYETERRFFRQAREGWAGEQRSVEAEIMDWADDVSFAVHDIEDFYRAGLIPLERVTSEPAETEQFISKASAYLSRNLRNFDPGLGAESFRRVSPLLVPDSPFRSTPKHRRAVHRMANQLITLYMEALSLVSGRAVTINANLRHEVLMLKQLTWQYVVNDPALASMQVGQARLIRELFNDLMTWVRREEADQAMYRLPTQLLHNYVTLRDDGEQTNEIREGLNRRGVEDKLYDDAIRARAVADYLSGLTEEQALALYSRMRATEPQSILQSWVR